MLGLLIYRYATGTFSSRGIEKHTYEQVAVRLLCADHHPDHESSPTRASTAARPSTDPHYFPLRLLGGEPRARARADGVARRRTERSELACRSPPGGCRQIAQLLPKAEEADSTLLEDGLTVPAEVARRQQRMEKLREATAAIQARAKERRKPAAARRATGRR